MLVYIMVLDVSCNSFHHRY